MKVLPEPGFTEVNINTEPFSSLPRMNSRLVRMTRKASLMMSRLCGLTTSSTSSSVSSLRRKEKALMWFFCEQSGISPTYGIVSDSKSLRPRTLVFSNSLT